MEFETIDPKKVGTFITELRKKHSLTQEELARKLHVSRKAVSKWESGLGLPSIDILKEMREIFNVSLDELVNGEFNPKDIKRTTKDTMSPYRLNRVFISSIVLVALFFLFVYWANTFNKIRIYNIYSTNTQMRGNFVVAKNKRIFSINDIRVLDNKINDIKYYDVEYRVMLDDTEILRVGNISNFKPSPGEDAKLLKAYVEDISIYIIDDLPNFGKADTNDYKILVKYIDTNLEEKSYEIDFEMSEFFSNNKLFYEKSEM